MSKFATMRNFCLAALLTTATLPMTALNTNAQDTQSEAFKELVDAANKEGKIVWYESVTPEQADEIIAEFQKTYPNIDFDYVAIGGSQRIARISQESTSGGPTADVSLHVASSIMTLAGQDFIATTDWEALGFDAASGQAPNEYMLRIDSIPYVTLYNTNRVQEGDVPRSYDAMLSDAHTGDWGTWALPDGLTNLVPTWGEEKTREYVKELAKTKPKMYRDHQGAAAAVAAGEVALANFLPYQSALPQIQKGAPIKIVFQSPLPVVPIYAFVPKLAEHPNAGRLFMAWLASPEGSVAFENATGRGSPFNKATKLGQLTEGMEVSAWSIEQQVEKSDEINKYHNEFAEILQGR